MVTRDEKLSGTVLVVDDEEGVLSVARKMLEKSGFLVLTASSGLGAVEKYRENADTIDLVLLDLTMPEMDGDETLEELKRIREDVRVILSSGYSESDLAQRFFESSLSGFIQKPYFMADLIEKVREGLTRNDRGE